MDCPRVYFCQLEKRPLIAGSALGSLRSFLYPATSQIKVPSGSKMRSTLSLKRLPLGPR